MARNVPFQTALNLREACKAHGARLKRASPFVVWNWLNGLVCYSASSRQTSCLPDQNVRRYRQISATSGCLYSPCRLQLSAPGFHRNFGTFHDVVWCLKNEIMQKTDNRTDLGSYADSWCSVMPIRACAPEARFGAT